MSDSYMSSSLSSVSLIESKYTLALKFFMNKSFPQSFEILKAQYRDLFHNFKSGVITEPIFNKVLNLYLTEVGLLLQSSHDFRVTKHEKQAIISELNSDHILNSLSEIYDDINDVSPEIIYNTFLIYYIGLDASQVSIKFTKIYPKINWDITDDKHYRKLVELVAMKILPELGQFSDARQLVNENSLLTNKDNYLTKLNQLEQQKLNEANKKEVDKDRKLREQRQKTEKSRQEKDLKFKTLKQIKETQGIQDKQVNPKPTSTNDDINTLKQKLLFNWNISKGWIKEHSPILLAIVVLLFITGRITKAKKIDIVKSLKETLGMAFKISYL